MALKRTLQMIQRDTSNETVETTFKNVNPNAAPADLQTAMYNLSGLTTSTYIDTYVTDMQSLNEMVGD